LALSSEDIARLYRQEARGLAGFFMRRTHDPEITLDLVAETFACVVADRRQFRGPLDGSGDRDGAARAWLYGIAHHQLSGWHRRGVVAQRAMRRLGIERPELADGEHERLIELAGLAEQRAQIATGLAGLPVDQRRAVELRVIDERPYDEVAHELGVSQQTARARVSRGLRALGAALDTIPADGHGPS
jgi:RNA polymerase sigma-70 factor, ECF subfamily